MRDGRSRQTWGEGLRVPPVLGVRYWFMSSSIVTSSPSSCMRSRWSASFRPNQSVAPAARSRTAAIPPTQAPQAVPPVSSSYGGSSVSSGLSGFGVPGVPGGRSLTTVVSPGAPHRPSASTFPSFPYRVSTQYTFPASSVLVVPER